jgi:hypothetical protein
MEDTQTPSAGKGMPQKTPQPGRERPGKHEAPSDASAEASLELPHERDQSEDMTSDRQSPKVQQADRDLKAGRQDTSKAAEMDHTYRKLK